MGTGQFDMKSLLEMLSEITGGEVSRRSMAPLLLLNESTAKRLFNGGTAWPRETDWRKSAEKIAEDLEGEYDADSICRAILQNKSWKDLSEEEKRRLKAPLNEAEKKYLYSKYGIRKLENCCYKTGDKYETFKGRLTYLVEEALTATEFCSAPGEVKVTVLDYLHKRGCLEDEISKLETMEDDDYPQMAKFLVKCAEAGRKEASKKKVSPKETTASDNVRLLRYEDLRELGLTAWDIANNLVENDYAVYPDIAPENEANASLWKEYLSRYPDTFAYLVDSTKRIVGNWSFLSITEEQERAMETGELIENTFNVQNTECLFLPGDYILYLLNLSCNEGYNKPRYYQTLLDELWKQMLAYAKDGIYFKRFCTNVFHPVYESFWRSMGFQFITENRYSGRVYALSLVPFPTTLNAKDKAIFAELKRVYNEHFVG